MASSAYIAAIAPASISLLGMLFFGNLLKESGVTERLAKTARNALIDTVTILLGLCVGASTDASRFLTPASLKIALLENIQREDLGPIEEALIVTESRIVTSSVFH